MSVQITSISGTSMCTGTWYSARLGFMMRPQSNEPRNRLRRISPVTTLTRTSQKSAPNECIDQFASSNGGGAVGESSPASLSSPATSSRCAAATAAPAEAVCCEAAAGMSPGTAVAGERDPRGTAGKAEVGEAGGRGAHADEPLALAARAGLGYQLRVVQNTPELHNMIVCTLCSCYPVSLLGPSPGWYKSFAYRSRTVREPRAVLAEFGVTLPEDVKISVWDSTSQARYMVLPLRPSGTGGMGADELAGLVTRKGLIGTALV
jgi:hypothetical protein